MKKLIFCLFMAAVTFNSYAQFAKGDTTYFKHKNINYSEIRMSSGFTFISNTDVKYDGDKATQYRSNNDKGEGEECLDSNIKEYSEKIHKKLTDDTQTYIFKYIKDNFTTSKKRALLDYTKREQEAPIFMFAIIIENDASISSIIWYLPPSHLDYLEKIDIANLDNEIRENLTIEKKGFDSQSSILLSVVPPREELIKFLENELAKLS